MPRRQFKTRSFPEHWQNHYRSAREWSGAISSPALFDNEYPLELEIGSGKGLFLSRQSVLDRDRNFVGIEIIDKYAKHAAARVAKTGVTNAMVLSGDAGELVRERVGDHSLDAIHVYFPDPWWKKKHRRRRVVSADSLPQFRRVLKPSGRFHFWTDVLDYFEDTIELVAEITPEFGVPLPERAAPSEHDLDYHTHFERRSRLHDIPVYRVRWELAAMIESKTN